MPGWQEGTSLTVNIGRKLKNLLLEGEKKKQAQMVENPTSHFSDGRNGDDDIFDIQKMLKET